MACVRDEKAAAMFRAKRGTARRGREKFYSENLLVTESLREHNEFYIFPLIVQWTGHKFPELEMEVRFLLRGQQRVDVIELQRFAKIYEKDVSYFL